MPIRVNLDCGDERPPGYLGFDILKRAGPDVICDLNVSIPLAGDRVEQVRAQSSLEHIDQLERLLGEVSRILKPGGTFYVYVPHWSNPFDYSDYTHRRWFGLVTFEYFVDSQDQVYRRVPVYSTPRFRTSHIRLIFGSPFSLLRWLMKGFQWLINRRVGLPLFNEYHLSSLVPCYAIEYALHCKE